MRDRRLQSTSSGYAAALLNDTKPLREKLFHLSSKRVQWDAHIGAAVRRPVRPIRYFDLLVRYPHTPSPPLVVATRIFTADRPVLAAIKRSRARIALRKNSRIKTREILCLEDLMLKPRHVFIFTPAPGWILQVSSAHTLSAPTLLTHILSLLEVPPRSDAS